MAPKRTKEEEEEEELEETAQEKKLRLAKLYLEQLRQQGEPWAGQARTRACAKASLSPTAAPVMCWTTGTGVQQLPGLLELPAWWGWHMCRGLWTDVISEGRGRCSVLSCSLLKWPKLCAGHTWAFRV